MVYTSPRSAIDDTFVPVFQPPPTLVQRSQYPPWYNGPRDGNWEVRPTARSFVDDRCPTIYSMAKDKSLLSSDCARQIPIDRTALKKLARATVEQRVEKEMQVGAADWKDSRSVASVHDMIARAVMRTAVVDEDKGEKEFKLPVREPLRSRDFDSSARRHIQDEKINVPADWPSLNAQMVGKRTVASQHQRSPLLVRRAAEKNKQSEVQLAADRGSSLHGIRILSKDGRMKIMEMPPAKLGKEASWQMRSIGEDKARETLSNNEGSGTCLASRIPLPPSKEPVMQVRGGSKDTASNILDRMALDALPLVKSKHDSVINSSLWDTPLTAASAESTRCETAMKSHNKVSKVSCYQKWGNASDQARSQRTSIRDGESRETKSRNSPASQARSTFQEIGINWKVGDSSTSKNTGRPPRDDDTGKSSGSNQSKTLSHEHQTLANALNLKSGSYGSRQIQLEPPKPSAWDEPRGWRGDVHHGVYHTSQPQATARFGSSETREHSFTGMANGLTSHNSGNANTSLSNRSWAPGPPDNQEKDSTFSCRSAVRQPSRQRTAFAGTGWISPHPLSEVAYEKPQSVVFVPVGESGIEKARISFSEWQTKRESEPGSQDQQREPIHTSPNPATGSDAPVGVQLPMVLPWPGVFGGSVCEIPQRYIDSAHGFAAQSASPAALPPQYNSYDEVQQQYPFSASNSRLSTVSESDMYEHQSIGGNEGPHVQSLRGSTVSNLKSQQEVHATVEQPAQRHIGSSQYHKPSIESEHSGAPQSSRPPQFLKDSPAPGCSLHNSMPSTGYYLPPGVCHVSPSHVYHHGWSMPPQLGAPGHSEISVPSGSVSRKGSTTVQRVTKDREHSFHLDACRQPQIFEPFIRPTADGKYHMQLPWDGHEADEGGTHGYQRRHRAAPVSEAIAVDQIHEERSPKSSAFPVSSVDRAERGYGSYEHRRMW